MILPVFLGLLTLCTGLWLFAIAPSAERKPELQELWKYDYAHRGLHSQKEGVPENSLSAFRFAAQCGFGIELDLRLTMDLQVAVHHDESLLRTCGADRRISELSFQELQDFRLFQTQEKIPSLSQVLSLIDGRVPLILELKSCENFEKLCKLCLAQLEGYRGLYCIESFDPRIVRWFKLHAPQVVRGQLMTRLKKGEGGLSGIEAFCGRNLLTNFLTRPHFEAYEFRWRDNLSLKTAKRVFNMQEASWTLKSEKDFQRAKAQGNLCIFEALSPQKEQDASKFSFEALQKGSKAAVFRERKGKARGLGEPGL